LRDAVEYILKAQGKWDGVVEQYISQRSPAATTPQKSAAE